MLKIAKSLLNDFHASFVITGEVLGQRPMSQRKDAMNIIERESGLKGVLVRPLCAGHMPISVPESEGIIRKEDMLDIAGRGRKRQENLALSFGILKNDIPSPAGGCLLTYAQIAEKVRETIERHSPDIPSKADFLMDVVGRKIALGEETVMIVPRDEKENDIAETLKFSGNCFLKIEDIPGPTAVIRGKSDGKILEHAAGICLRYTKERGKSGHVAMWGVAPDSLVNKVKVPVLDDDSIGKSKP
jgi:hypothetical protein